MTAKAFIRVARWGGITLAALAAAAACVVLRRGPVLFADGWFALDALSAFHLGVLALVFGSASWFAEPYFEGTLTPSQARRFAALWFGAFCAMVLVLCCGNLGLMWVGIEATTLLTAFLICTHVTPLSLEATWKYLVVCSVGVAFAFMGTLLVAASAHGLQLDASSTLLWTQLRERAVFLHPGTMKLAFLFLLVGYGTKAGLAPLHGWLPDAHSQAPAPVSALFSGFMLNASFYCLLRILPIAEAATGNVGWARGLLVFFGLASIVVAACFIVFQHDSKRLLAYHSVEHLGIIALAAGLGGLGTFAALWHTLNHALCKALAFFCAGRLGQAYGSHDLRRMAGALRAGRLWAAAFFASLLALIGVAPFAIFMSELQILRAAAERRAFIAMAVFLLGVSVVFVGALKHALVMAWGEPVQRPEPEKESVGTHVLVWGMLGMLLVLGLWLPTPLSDAMRAAAGIVEGRP
ncbi:MAG: proton-conducting transporter membrane subunit [Elusimicrobiota bacterium]